MENAEALLAASLPALERFFRFRVDNRADAEDLLQDVCVTVLQKADTLRSEDAFRAWLFTVARHKCIDYYRARARHTDVPFDTLSDAALTVGLYGRAEPEPLDDLFAELDPRDRQLLYLCYVQRMPQAEVAKRLNIPVGTVKSRLFAVRRRLKCRFPYTPKGETPMEKPFPAYLPAYTITPSELPPFAVRWEEMMGWFIVPRLGERLRWAIYDLPSRKRAEYTTMEVVGRAAVHGVEGVEIVATEYDPLPENILPGQNPVERRFIAQLTDTHCRILAQSAVEDGVKRMYTFLDGDPFTDNWGFGPDNVGNEINLAPKGDIVRTGDVLTAADKPFLLDIVGRYTVSINGKSYDTACVIDCYTYVDGVVSEQYLDAEGRTILWRRFNRDDWKCKPGEPLWHERLPGAERLTVNGTLYVHWYDCITDRVL